MALSWQPLAQTGIKASPPEMGTVQSKRTVFSTRLCIGGSGPLRANQGVSKVEPRYSHAVCTLWVHQHTPPQSRPFCWSRTYLQTSLQEVTSQEIYPATSGKVLRQKGLLRHQGYSVLKFFHLCESVHRVNVLLTNVSFSQLTSTEEPKDRSTCWSLPCTIPRGDSELIYHTSGCVTVIHCEVELWYVYTANGGQGSAVIATSHINNTDVNTVWYVRINPSYFQGKRSVPSEANNVSQICTCKIAHSSRFSWQKRVGSVLWCQHSVKCLSTSILSEADNFSKEQMFTCKVAHRRRLACTVL